MQHKHTGTHIAKTMAENQPLHCNSIQSDSIRVLFKWKMMHIRWIIIMIRNFNFWPAILLRQNEPKAIATLAWIKD